jgi:hypothetical protein
MGQKLSPHPPCRVCAGVRRAASIETGRWTVLSVRAKRFPESHDACWSCLLPGTLRQRDEPEIRGIWAPLGRSGHGMLTYHEADDREAAG